MKKLLFVLLLSLFLAACGSNEPTTDAMAVGSKDNKASIIENDYGQTYEIVNWYVSDDTDDEGFNEMDFKGYKVKFSMAAVKDEEGNEYIGFFAETENTTDRPVHYNGDMEIVTDNQDQTYNDDGIGSSEPGVKIKGFSAAPLEYGTPESFTVTFEPPYLDNNGSYSEGGFGDNIEMEFKKE